MLELQNIISTCIDDVARWMRSNRLQLNTAKTEVLWSTSNRCLHLLPVSPILVGTDQVMPVSIVRNLRIYMDADVSMMSHVSKTVAACFAILRQLRNIRRSIPRSVLQSLVSSLVLQLLDYSNATLAGIPSHLTKRMQSVLNSAAQLVFSASRYGCITPLLTQLHWLQVPDRIKFKLAVLVYNAYTRQLCRTSADETRQHLRSASTSSFVVTRTHLSTIGDRAFPVAAARLWNTLPPNVMSASSVSVFRKHLKTHLFSHSFPESPVVPVQWFVISDTINDLVTIIISSPLYSDQQNYDN